MRQRPCGGKPPKKPKRIYGITLDMAQDHLEEWLNAEMEITTHQVTVQRITKLPQLQKQIL